MADMQKALTRAMIRERRLEAHRKISEGRDELSACDEADKLLDSFGVPREAEGLFSPSDTAKIVDNVKRRLASGNPFRPGSIKACIWQALYEGPDLWVDAHWVQERVSQIKGQDVPLASISPNLSQMKGEYIERDGLKVALKRRLNENGEAEASASPDADEVTGSSDTST